MRARTRDMLGVDCIPNPAHLVYPVRMKWKATIVGPTGEAYTNTTAFRLLYTFQTRQEAEAHAECLRSAGTEIVEYDEHASPADDCETPEE
jgi:hypothetical protein